MRGANLPDQDAGAGRLLPGSSPVGAVISGVGFRMGWTLRFCSTRKAATKRQMASSLGKLPATLAGRQIAPFCCSVEGIARWSLGKDIQTSPASSASSINLTSFGNVRRIWSATARRWLLAASAKPGTGAAEPRRHTRRVTVAQMLRTKHAHHVPRGHPAPIWRGLAAICANVSHDLWQGFSQVNLRVHAAFGGQRRRPVPMA